MGRTVHNHIAVGGDIFRTGPGWLWISPSLLYNGYLIFCVSKTTGARRWQPNPIKTEFKEGVQLYNNSPSGPSWPVPEWTSQYFILYVTLWSFLVIFQQLRVRGILINNSYSCIICFKDQQNTPNSIYVLLLLLCYFHLHVSTCNPVVFRVAFLLQE